MRQFWLYLYMEWKKMNQGLPYLMVGTLVLAVFLSGFLFVFQDKDEENGKIKTIQVGIVAAENEPYLDWMIQTLQNIESTKYVCEFTKVTEKQGDSALQAGDIDSLFIIPEDYIASLIHGSNEPVVIRFGRSQVDIASFFIRQIALAASEYILDTEAGIYAMKEYYIEKNLPDVYEDEMELNLLYLEKVLGRQNIIKPQEIDIMEHMGTIDYYFVAGIVLFLLFWGLACSSVLKREPRSLRQKLCQAGVGIPKQVLARAAAFCAVYLSNYFFAAIVVVLVVVGAGGSIGGISLSGAEAWILFLVQILPVVLLAAVCILFAYEILGDSVGGTVFLFLIILGMGFISGCFYPFQYLPESMRTVSEWLPVRMMFEYVSAAIRQESMVSCACNIFVCMGCIYLLTTGMMAAGRRKAV